MKYISYYVFDWDDNILIMDSKVIVLNSKGEEVYLNSSDFSKYRQYLAEKIPFEYNGNTIVGFPLKENGDNDFNRAFFNFRDNETSDNIFLDDAKKSLSKKMYAPSWNDFIECLINGSIFCIITARGHHDDKIRETVEYIIDNEIDKTKLIKMYNNIHEYNKLFNIKGNFEHIEDYLESPSQTQTIKKYLDSCEYIAIYAPHRETDFKNTSEIKRKYLKEFIERVNKFASRVNMKAKIGYSDDDDNNINYVKDLIKNIDHEEFPHVAEYVIKHTKEGNNSNELIFKKIQ